MSFVRVTGFCLCLVLLALGCAQTRPPSSDPRISISDGWLAMGTFFEVDLRVAPGDADRARDWIESARLEIERLEKIYSRHDPESRVSSLNRELAREAVFETGTRLDAELEAILFLAVEIWEASGGAFDITVGPLVELWAKASATGRWPSVESLRRAKRRVGSEGLLLTGDGNLGLTKPGMRIDLDGLSKGVVLDRLRERLEADLPDAAALLNFGESSILAVGDPDGRGWRLVLRPSEGSVGPPVVLQLRDRALSVSSSTGSIREIAGERVSHVIDPRTGNPIARTVEAIVVADRAAIADGWSTGLLVLGGNRSTRRLVEKAGLEASVRDSSGREIETEGWARYVSDEPLPER